MSRARRAAERVLPRDSSSHPRARERSPGLEPGSDLDAVAHVLDSATPNIGVGIAEAPELVLGFLKEVRVDRAEPQCPARRPARAARRALDLIPRDVDGDRRRDPRQAVHLGRVLELLERIARRRPAGRTRRSACPELPKAHDGVSSSCARSAASTRPMSSPRAASFCAIRSKPGSHPVRTSASSAVARSGSRATPMLDLRDRARDTHPRRAPNDLRISPATPARRTRATARARYRVRPLRPARRCTELAARRSRSAGRGSRSVTPPPITCTVSIPEPVTASISSRHEAVLTGEALEDRAQKRGPSSGAVCPVRTQAARMRAGMSPGASSSGGRGRTTHRPARLPRAGELRVLGRVSVAQPVAAAFLNEPEAHHVLEQPRRLRRIPLVGQVDARAAGVGSARPARRRRATRCRSR